MFSDFCYFRFPENSMSIPYILVKKLFYQLANSVNVVYCVNVVYELIKQNYI